MGVAKLMATWGGSISSYNGSEGAKLCFLTMFLLMNQNTRVVTVMVTIAVTTTVTAITPMVEPALKQLVESFSLDMVNLSTSLLVEVGSGIVYAYMFVVK